MTRLPVRKLIWRGLDLERLIAAIQELAFMVEFMVETLLLIAGTTITSVLIQPGPHLVRPNSGRI